MCCCKQVLMPHFNMVCFVPKEVSLLRCCPSAATLESDTLSTCIAVMLNRIECRRKPPTLSKPPPPSINSICPWQIRSYFCGPQTWQRHWHWPLSLLEVSVAALCPINVTKLYVVLWVRLVSCGLLLLLGGRSDWLGRLSGLLCLITRLVVACCYLDYPNERKAKSLWTLVNKRHAVADLLFFGNSRTTIGDNSSNKHQQTLC